MEEPRTYKFRRREIVLIFMLLLVGGAVIFSLGIKVGQGILYKGNPSVKEEVKLSNTYDNSESYDDNTLPEKEATATEPVTDQQMVEKEKETKTVLSIKEITADIKGKYTIQISSHQNEQEAKKIAGELYRSGYKLAYYMEAEVPGKGIWYRVGIGFFKQKASAETFAEMLKRQGKIASYLVRKID